MYLPTILPKRTRSELAEFVIASIEEAEVTVPASSRLRQMHELHHRSQGTIGPDHPEFQTALEAERDLQLLGFVFDQFSMREADDALRQLLRKLVKDSVLPQDDRRQSVGRDAAFELYAGAVCKGARFEPVVFEEPDVTFYWDDMKVGIAAKRIKNVKNLEQRVRDATDQIARSGMPGIIALDACLAFNPNNDRVADPISDTDFMHRYRAVLSEIWSEHQGKVQSIISRANVIGIIVHDHQVRFLPNHEWSLASMTLRVTAAGQPAEQQKQFDAWATCYTYALPNQEEIS